MMSKVIKRLLLLFVYILVVSGVLAQTPTEEQNYILENIIRRAGYTQLGQLRNKPVDSVNRTVRYYDGLGRLSQTAQWQGSPGKKDVSQPVVYDAMRREAVKYLPYSEQDSNNGSYKTAALTNQLAYYGSSSWDTNVVKTPNPYAKTVFEPSPLNRVLEQGAEGAIWQPVAGSAAGHTAKVEYGTNTSTGNDAVKLWTVTTTGASSSANYGAGKLYLTTGKDENWVTANGKMGVVDEFKDFDGQVVMKRVWETTTKSLSTYYVYDDFGNLRYVLPPAVNENGIVTAISSFTESDTDFKRYLYGYHYDQRQRIVEKKVPGKGWEYIVYNKLDQAILTQDSIQRVAHQWQYTKYDAIGRVASTGIHSSTANRVAAQDSANAATSQWDTRAPGAASYSSQAFPNTGLSIRLVNYYDDYTFSGATTSTLQPGGITKSSMTQGLLTCTRTYLTDGSGALISILYYDDKGRVIQTASQNHLGGTDITTNTYNFTDQVTQSVRVHKASSSGTATTITTSYAYDHVGRHTSTREKINSEAEVVLSKDNYNGIGQLRAKQLHSTDNGTSFLSTVTYTYNERGWLKKQSSGQFTEELKYNDGTTPQYNGNISGQLWGTSTTTPNTFTYSYDKLNRLTSGVSTGVAMGEVLTYDVMGNIKTLNRDGGGVRTYNYTGNRLTSTTGTSPTGTYAYNGNGNATTDGRTGMAFTYNYLDLPQTASKTGTSLAYLYDATGKKLRKTATVSSITTQRDYLDGIEYNKIGTAAADIDIIHTPEGYALKSGTTYVYHYNLTDHLGNVRATIKKGASALEVVQRDDYYPFGLEKVALGGTNKYLYNEKELQSELGQYDYGARLYDPVIGRWNVIDPLAEKMRRWNPYNYAFDNPIRFIDPDGMVGRDLKFYKSYGDGPGDGDDDDGNQKGFIRNATSGFRYLSPIKAALKDVSFFVLDALGFNAIDDKIADIQENGGDASLSDKVDLGVKTLDAVATVLTLGEGEGKGKVVAEVYKRPSNATTAEQRASVQGQPCVTCGAKSNKMVADHKKPLVKEHYETGTIDKNRMRSKDAVQPQCPTCSAQQGAEMSRYSKQQKKKNGLD